MSAVRPSRPPASVDAPAATDPSSQRSPTLFIVEDHAALRRGVELLMRSEGVRVVGTAGDAAAAAELIPRRRPDVVLADISPESPVSNWLGASSRRTPSWASSSTPDSTTRARCGRRSTAERAASR